MCSLSSLPSSPRSLFFFFFLPISLSPRSPLALCSRRLREPRRRDARPRDSAAPVYTTGHTRYRAPEKRPKNSNSRPEIVVAGVHEWRYSREMHTCSVWTPQYVHNGRLGGEGGSASSMVSEPGLSRVRVHNIYTHLQEKLNNYFMSLFYLSVLFHYSTPRVVVSNTSNILRCTLVLHSMYSLRYYDL